MTRRRLMRLAAVVAVAAVGVTCGGSSGSSSSSTSPTAPGTTTPTGPACRTYPTRANVHTVTSGTSVTFDALEVASFDSATKKATVDTQFANGAPCSTAVVSYNSVADFVDEVRVIPPVTLAIRADGTNSGQCGSGSGATVYVYDSQRRVVQITNSASAVTTYTAWDSSGRPTAGTTSGGQNLSIVYNDPGRSYVVTTTQANALFSTGTLSFDANGNQASIVVVQGNVTTTTTWTTTATAQACK